VTAPVVLVTGAAGGIGAAVAARSELVWFLPPPAAAPITGAKLPIDFGLSAGM